MKIWNSVFRGSFVFTLAMPSVIFQGEVQAQGEGMLAPGQVAPDPFEEGEVRFDIEEGVIAPDDPGQQELDARTAPQLSDKELEALRLQHLELREADAARLGNNLASATPWITPSLDQVSGIPARPTELADASDELLDPYKNIDILDDLDFRELPSAAIDSLFFIGLNNFNDRAAIIGSTLAEPAAATAGRRVFMTGNTHAGFWTQKLIPSPITPVPIPPGPPEAPIACCDTDVVYDEARGTLFWSVLYVGPGRGRVRIFVRDPIAAPNQCSFTIPTPPNTTPDYPHLGLSNKHLYLTVNNLGIAPTQVWRFGLQEMADCETTPFQVFNFDSLFRVFVPIEGAREAMYWGMVESPGFFPFLRGTFRIFKWHQDAANPVSFVRLISPANFVNPVCNGGVGNFDFIQKTTAWREFGFRLRGVLARDDSLKGMTTVLRFYWNVGPDPQHQLAHVHAAAFRESDLALIGQPHIFRPDMCLGYPVVSANERGAVGLSIAGGGGPSGRPAEGYVSIDDDLTPGMTFAPLVMTAFGTINRADGRYGDYFTAHPVEPCDMWFSVTNYSLIGFDQFNILPNVRYVEFGRGRDVQCYLRTRGLVYN